MSNRQLLILTFGHDPGGARAVLRVVQHLAAADACRLAVFTAGPASAIYTHVGVDHTPLADDPGDVLDRLRPDAVLTATSIACPSDRAFVAAARRRSIPSMTVVDYWENYVHRFTSVGPAAAPFDSLPDRVCSIDREMTDGMVAAGIPRERIVETGQPVFDDLVRAADPRGRALRAAGRRGWDLDDSAFALLYASQPVAAFYGDSADHPQWLGYTEFEVAEFVVDCVERIAADVRPGLRLFLRPHPREDRDFFDRLARRDGPVPIRVDTLPSPHESVLAADIVAGMSSIILLEAALMGRVALSLQPGLRLPDTLKSNAAGLTFPAYDRPAAEKLLRQAVADARPFQVRLDDALARSPLQGGATARVARALLELAGRRAPSETK